MQERCREIYRDGKKRMFKRCKNQSKIEANEQLERKMCEDVNINR